MINRTDLALEKMEQKGEKIKVKTLNGVRVTAVDINDEKKEKLYERPRGKYITLEFQNILKIIDCTELENQLEKALLFLMPKKREKVLVAGLGNRDITCDSVGPLTAEKILVTRHLDKKLNVKNVAVTVPDVVGKTGIETIEKIKGITDIIKPDLVIVIDSLACTSIRRLFKTIQLCNSGITPGSGIKSERKEISKKTLGIPVIAIGVPTVADVENLAFELSGKEAIFSTDLIITPKDADIQCHKFSEILARVLNRVLQPEIEEEILQKLV